MAQTHTEREGKFEGLGDGPLPALDGLPGVARVAPGEPEELDALYYDTPGLALLGAGSTLRRRTGGHDAGWHLKTPAKDGARHETRVSAADGEGEAPPGEITRLVRARARGRQVVPVARLRTHRERLLLLDARDRLLAEVAVDRVSGQVLGTVRTDGEREGEPPGDRTVLTAWSEVEVELDRGDEALLTAVGKRLRKGGLRPGGHPSKLQHALAAAGAAPRPPARPAPGSAGAVVLDRLRTQTEALLTLDAAVRADEPDSVHRMRVAVRRLRSALKTYRGLFLPGSTRELERGLRRLSRTLGEARDHEVLGERLGDDLAALAADPATAALTGTGAGRITGEEARAYRTAWRGVVEVLDSGRYFALLDALCAWLADPPFGSKAERTARGRLEKAVRRRRKKLLARADHALTLERGPARDEALHATRRAAKHLRYAAETARPVVGKPARKLAKRAKAVQKLLGEHQDSVVARRALPLLADRAHRKGEETFGHGLLYAYEGGRAQEAFAAVPGALRKVSKRRLRHWR
ncbi:CYTH and CHAD domain-containing protein [Streptomyces sp. ICBB 8177]|uniref:CYTH and CHAD domain-containing protein n=1 Tax=Streptomyces sp. ICBB 8177 TaxID=563922 RepID=UPI000D67ACA1|nr:CYTH and CHAD domain-containing protein [Streptomyces sp. ICBB 8177]PWI42854.1 metal-binding protein [Streptomyces sp. ICBB 8177]